MTSVGIPTIIPPELSSVRGEDVVKFKEEYDQYLRNVGEANRNRTNTQRFPPCGIKACISAELLISLTELKTFPDCDTITQVSDDHVKTWIESRARCSSDDMASHVKHAIGRLRFKTDISDPQGACMQFFADVMTELRRNRVSHVVSEAPKALISQLLPKLEPPIVRETIRAAFEYWPKEKKYDFHHFREKVSEISVESAKYGTKRDRDVLPGASNCIDRPTKKNKNNPKSNGKVVRESGKHPKSGKGKSGKTKAWSDPCLNPKCSKVHHVKDCEDTTEEEKKALLKHHYDEKKKKLSRMSNPTQSDGRWSCMIEGLVPCSALGDIGGDESAMPRCILNTLCHEGIQASVEQLSEPIHLSAAVKLPENVQFTASARIQLSITHSLPCGPLRLRGVEFLVVDQDMEEILLGRPLLRCLAFDLGDHLEKVRNEMDNADIESLMHSSPEYDTLKIASLPEYKGLWYNSTEEDPIPASDSITEDVSVMDNSDVEKALDAALLDASEKGMSEEGLNTMRSMLREFKDIFRTNMGPDPPASIDPLRIRMKEGCRPRRATQRRYAAPQRPFISSTIRNLEKAKAVYANPKATWASPALAVQKAGPEKFRFTVDLRGPNSETIPIASAMPDLEGMIASIAGSILFVKLDMIHAFWQLALHPDSQECMSIQTPIGVYTPTRVLQGSTDAGNHFQSATAQVFSELQESLAQWEDDFLMHASNESELLKLLRRYFELCSKFGLKLHASKCEFYLKEAKFCGRIIDQSGVRYDPRRMDTLISMKLPEFASDLQQFLCATNWMRTSIPDYSRVVAPLHDLMEQFYSKAGKRTKKAVRNLSLSGLWGATHTSAFNQIRDHLVQALKLAHPKADHTICLFADASETHWASVLTQVPKSEMHLDFDKQTLVDIITICGILLDSSSDMGTTIGQLLVLYSKW